MKPLVVAAADCAVPLIVATFVTRRVRRLLRSVEQHVGAQAACASLLS
jgi:hypothetical protein